MNRLEGSIQAYAWGQLGAIATFLGSAPSGRPEAELWLGAHPAAPSRLGPTGRSLRDVIAEAPTPTLGPAVAARFGELPFLLKLLAADTPLSIQAHPSKAQAERGFADEEARQVPLATRNYKDANHKPELLVALGPFEALCGFRDAEESAALFDELGLVALARDLRTSGNKAVFERLLRQEGAASLVAEARAAAERAIAAGSAFQRTLEWTLELSRLYPADAGCITALLLNYVALEAGEGLYLPAGNLHAYLRGFGVEIMASSDNVLRGGLTPKHVDVDELLRVVDFDAAKVLPLRATVSGDSEVAWSTPAADFHLSRLTVDGTLRREPRGPEILLAESGTMTLAPASGGVGENRRDLTLQQGDAAFVAHDDGPYSLQGSGSLFRATVGDLS
ncbi:MAG: mannose-6-phosphate isomerase, class I [Myxococcales bacterium]|nr:mannose-6-phosphate isomerase, class I [Myxococcales bacterium]